MLITLDERTKTECRKLQQNTYEVNGQLSFDESGQVSSIPVGDSSDARRILTNADAFSPHVTISEVRRLTNLDSHGVVEILSFFEEITDESGTIEREDFCAQFTFLSYLPWDELSTEDKKKFSHVVDRLFDIFDPAGEGRLQLIELVTGLSVLCRGSRIQKAEFAFRLHDQDGDEMISLKEAEAYLSAVFKLQYLLNSEMSGMMGVGYATLASVTAQQLFSDSGISPGGLLPFDKFKAWGSSLALPTEASCVIGPVSASTPSVAVPSS
jgi:Ca2+-binding EF-hand superfamily protein